MKGILRDDIATVLDAFENEGPRDLDVALDAIGETIKCHLGATLKRYADGYCEGWCNSSPPGAKFVDCGGCEARIAIEEMLS